MRQSMGVAVLGLFVLLLSVFVGPEAQAQSCQSLAEVPGEVQVVWVSPMGRRVKRGAHVEVVRLQDLRKFVVDNKASEARVVQALGMAPRWGGRRAERLYKVVIFDVRAEWMCRPVDGQTPGLEMSGVVACAGQVGGRAYQHGPGFTGCGYTLDTGASTRGIDVFRVRWSDASAGGFCTMPLSRFIKGA